MHVLSPQKALRLVLAFALLALLCVALFPDLAHAQVVNEGKPDASEGYVPCGRLDANKDNIVDNPCGFSHVIELARRLIVGWIMAGVIIASLGFSYAGFLYITAMGSQEKISHAHSIFVKTFFGFVFMLSAWLIAKVFENEFLCSRAEVANPQSPCFGAEPLKERSLLLPNN